jgi:hypothetical protein
MGGAEPREGDNTVLFVLGCSGYYFTFRWTTHYCFGRHIIAFDYDDCSAAIGQSDESYVVDSDSKSPFTVLDRVFIYIYSGSDSMAGWNVLYGFYFF